MSDIGPWKSQFLHFGDIHTRHNLLKSNELNLILKDTLRDEGCSWLINCTIQEYLVNVGKALSLIQLAVLTDLSNHNSVHQVFCFGFGWNLVQSIFKKSWKKTLLNFPFPWFSASNQKGIVLLELVHVNASMALNYKKEWELFVALSSLLCSYWDFYLIFIFEL